MENRFAYLEDGQFYPVNVITKLSKVTFPSALLSVITSIAIKIILVCIFLMYIYCEFDYERQAGGFRLGKLRAPRIAERLKPDDDGGNKDGEASSGSDVEDDGPLLMDEEERQEWRRKIREVIDMNPDVQEEVDPVERRKKMQKLLADYPLFMEEDDPDWPEDSDGWGFSLGQFVNKITIKNVKDNDDENYDSENELVWQDDNYIRTIKDITTRKWEETVFKDFSPLIVLVHNRYRRLEVI
ncbi:thioredoxin-like fold domain-containing protein MRL7L, chloroplastic isoform X2 [Camellia sinensis]|uniref:thioredoxin-like fold domain-containing protein MRL7L, chloroplastic isoform X2 n=1 Tax=Camellia sinensis TaxID=4442 RepID=UPI001036878E|nr:thioredoxin-like fold domain-containing protein MRL7L, chloroplastic isoform X2 [Camellia sinensis]